MHDDPARGRREAEALATEMGLRLPHPEGPGWALLIIDGRAVGWYRPPPRPEPAVSGPRPRVSYDA